MPGGEGEENHDDGGINCYFLSLSQCATIVYTEYGPRIKIKNQYVLFEFVWHGSHYTLSERIIWLKNHG